MTTIRKVSFQSRGIHIIGDLYLPSVEATDRKKAAVIVGHPGTGIKEQASGTYARLLAESGFVSLAFDAAYQGESGGEPRNLEDPYQRAEDFKSAVTFLSILGNEVDPDRIGVAGICASGGYCIFAAQTDIRMKAVAGIVPMCTGTQARVALEIESKESNRAALDFTLRTTAQARIAEAHGDQPVTMDITDVFEEAKEYYKTPRGYHPRCTNQQLNRSVELALTYNSYAYIDWISPRPLLMILAPVPLKSFHTAPFIQKAYEQAKQPKELVIMEGKTHLDMYDDVSVSLPTLVEFMDRWLCS